MMSQDSPSRKRNLETANGTCDGPPSKKSRESVPDLPMVFVVMHTNYLGNVVYEAKPLDVYLSLEDANRRVRNECITWGDRDDPDADFQEGILDDGRIWWKWRDETGYGYDTDIHSVLLRPPSSEPVRDWGRDIGEPCPEKSDSEVDSSDEESNSSMPFIGWIPPEDRYRYEQSSEVEEESKRESEPESVVSISSDSEEEKSSAASTSSDSDPEVDTESEPPSSGSILALN